jgi:hypothetical protein
MALKPDTDAEAAARRISKSVEIGPSRLLNNDFSRVKTSGFPGKFDDPLFKTCLVQQAAR